MKQCPCFCMCWGLKSDQSMVMNVLSFDIFTPFLIFNGQALVSLAEEIARSGIPEGSRKINGKFIQSHLLSRLEGVMMLAIFF